MTATDETPQPEQPPQRKTELVGDLPGVTHRGQATHMGREATKATKEALVMADANRGKWVATAHGSASGVTALKKAWPEYQWVSRSGRLYVMREGPRKVDEQPDT